MRVFTGKRRGWFLVYLREISAGGLVIYLASQMVYQFSQIRISRFLFVDYSGLLILVLVFNIYLGVNFFKCFVMCLFRFWRHTKKQNLRYSLYVWEFSTKIEWREVENDKKKKDIETSTASINFIQEHKKKDRYIILQNIALPDGFDKVFSDGI